MLCYAMNAEEVGGVGKGGVEWEGWRSEMGNGDEWGDGGFGTHGWERGAGAEGLSWGGTGVEWGGVRRSRGGRRGREEWSGVE